IQHDILPRFAGSDRLLALVGEPRHRRSYLYDLGSGAQPSADGGQPRQGALAAAGARRLERKLEAQSNRISVFHNYTVVTIALEYQWAINPAGTQILIGAERDGNTVSPERGVYAVDLEHKVTKAALIARLESNLKTETALKSTATRIFQPIAVDV